MKWCFTKHPRMNKLHMVMYKHPRLSEFCSLLKGDVNKHPLRLNEFCSLLNDVVSKFDRVRVHGMSTVFFLREKSNLNLIIDVLALARTDCMCRCPDRWSKAHRESLCNQKNYLCYLIPRLLPGAHLIRCMVFHQRK